MGQEVKNHLRAKFKYGLMGSSAKTGKKIFRGSPEHFWDKNSIWDRDIPPPTHQLQSTCVGEGSRVPNLQTEFNYLDLFKSYGIFSDFIVPTWSPSSLHRPRCPHVVPVIPTSSLHRPCHPHVVPIAPRRSPCGLHGLWSPHVVPVVPTLSLSSSCCPHSPPEGPHVVSMVCGLHMLSLSSPHRPHIVPVILMLSP